MKNKLKLMIIFCIVIVMSTFITVNAESTTVTASGGSVNSQEEITITLTSTVSLQGYTISVTEMSGFTFKSVAVPSGVNGSPNGSTIGGVSSTGTTTLATYKFIAPSVTADKNCEIKFKISGILSANDEELDNTSSKATITVKAPVVEPETPPTTTTPEPETPPATTVTKSSEARLKNFGITPNDFSGFKKDKLEYSTTVPNDVAEVEIYAEKQDAKATVEGAGKVSLKEGNNTFEVKVTAEDGKTTKTYKLTIKRKTAEEQATENAEARLKNLGIKPEEYDFTGFNSEKTEYSVEVPNDIEEIEVYATAMNSSAQITGIGMIELKEGVNELPIEVIAADGTKKTYTLTVTRKGTEKAEKFGLSILTVQGFNLKPKFDAEVYEYTIDLNEDIDSLKIGTRPTDDEASVEIIGNENLQQGENVITILVKNEETEEVATYQIIVTKNVKTVAGTVSTPETPQKSWLEPSTWGKEEIIKIAIIIVLIILIICAVVLKINISKEDAKNKMVDLPGAEELDRAITEHQELAEEPSFETEQVEERNEEGNTQMEYSQNMTQDGFEQNYIEEIAMNRYGDMREDNASTKRRGRHF